MIEIRIESSWDTDDGEGRSIELRVTTRSTPHDDPTEDSRYFTANDLGAVKDYLAGLIDRHQDAFAGRERGECQGCHGVFIATELSPERLCRRCIDSIDILDKG